MPSVNKHKDEIITHLGFLGYETEDLKAESGHTYIAKSNTKSNMVVRMFNNVTILTIRYMGYPLKVLKSKDFYELINQTNQNVMGKWYYQVDDKDKDVTIVIEADYYDYNKVTFGSLVESLETEVQMNLQNFSKFLEE